MKPLAPPLFAVNSRFYLRSGWWGRLCALPTLAAFAFLIDLSIAGHAVAGVTYTYDKVGQLICVNNGAGGERGYKYDEVGNLLEITATCAAAIQAASSLQSLNTGQTSAQIQAEINGTGAAVDLPQSNGSRDATEAPGDSLIEQ